MAQDIPLVGDKLGDAASFLRDMRLGILSDLRKKLSGNGKAIEFIRETLYDVLGPNKLNILLDTNKDNRISIEDVMVGWYDKLGNLMQNWSVGGELPGGADAIQFDMDLGQNLLGTGFDLPLDFSIPGFSLDVDGGFALDIGWKFDFGFGFSLQDSFYLATNEGSELSLDIKAYLDGSPTDPAITPFKGEGNLLFLKAEIEDNNPDGRASGIYGGLSLALKGDERGRMTIGKLLSGRAKDLFGVSFGVDTKLDLGMTLGLDGAKGLPKIVADLEFDWSWKLGEEMKAPSFGLREMRIDIGSLLNDFVIPISEQVRDVLKPMKPLIEVLSKEITGMNLIAPKNPNLMGLINLIMEIKGRKPIDWSFVSEAKQMLGLVNQLVDKFANLQPGDPLPLGDIMGLGTSNVQATPTQNAPQSTEIDKFLQENTRQAGSVKKSAGTKTTPRSGFQIMPYIKDISNWKNLLTGGSATLFTYELPLLEFAADFNALLAVIP